MQRWCSNNRNVVVQEDTDGTASSTLQADDYTRATVTVQHWSLVEVRQDDRSTTIHCKASDRDVVTIFNARDSALHLDDLTTNHILRNCDVKLHKGAITEDKLHDDVSSIFRVVVTKVDDDALGGDEGETRKPRLHPAFEVIFKDAVARRKEQDEEEVSAYIRQKTLAYQQFEAKTKADAEVLSAMARTQTPPPMTGRVRLLDKALEEQNPAGSVLSHQSSISCLESPSTISSSIDRTRRNVLGHEMRPPTRSATAPLPKSALLPPARKSSLSAAPTNQDQTGQLTAKKVMFVDTEPLRIDAIHSIEPSDVETPDLELYEDHDDFFDMDEAIPVVPVPLSSNDPIDPAADDSRIMDRASFGRQDATGLVGSFKLKSMDKYKLQTHEVNDDDEAGMTSSSLSSSGPARSPSSASSPSSSSTARLCSRKGESEGVPSSGAPSAAQFGTSLPRDIITQTHQHTHNHNPSSSSGSWRLPASSTTKSQHNQHGRVLPSGSLKDIGPAYGGSSGTRSRSPMDLDASLACDANTDARDDDDDDDDDAATDSGTDTDTDSDTSTGPGTGHDGRRRQRRRNGQEGRPVPPDESDIEHRGRMWQMAVAKSMRLSGLVVAAPTPPP